MLCCVSLCEPEAILRAKYVQTQSQFLENPYHIYETLATAAVGLDSMCLVYCGWWQTGSLILSRHTDFDSDFGSHWSLRRGEGGIQTI